MNTRSKELMTPFNLIFILLLLTSCVTLEEDTDKSFPIHEPKISMIEMDVDKDCNRLAKKIETYLNTYYIINCENRFIITP